MTHSGLGRFYNTGNTLSEYGLLIGLVAVLAVGSLYNFRGSLAQLFGHTSGQVARYNILAPVGGAAGASGLRANGGSGGGARFMQVNRATGLPTFMTSGGSAPVNATSTDGDKVTSVGSWGQAMTFEQLAKQEKNPEFAAYYAELAYFSYYMGAAEGRLDGLQPFQFAEAYYEPDDALSDLMNLQGQLQAKLSNPPAGISSTKAFKTAMPLAADVFNIAETYRGALSSQILPDGTVLPFRIQDTRERGPGTALSVAPFVYSHPNPEYVGDMPGAQVMNYDTLKATAQQVVADRQSEAPLTKQTLTDAIDLDQVQEPAKQP